MKIIEINSFVPHLSYSPHKIHIVEFSREELSMFKLKKRATLQCLEPYSDIGDVAISVEGIDGDLAIGASKDPLSTHGLIIDLRPMMVKVLIWEKDNKGGGGIAELPTELVKAITK